MKPLFPVHLKGVRVRRRGKTLLGPVTLDLKGEGFTVIVGPNGAGKTTFLKTLFGLERLSAGGIEWPRPMAEVDLRRSYVFQQPVMLRRSVAENLAFPLKLRKATDIRDQTHQWATRVGLAQHLNSPAPRLSGGEKQKLALARALITKPDLLVLDEPCASLDGRATREIEEILQHVLAEGTRIVMATHDLGQARRLATEAIFLFKGNVQAHQPAPDFFSQPATDQLRAFLNGDILE